VYSCKLSKTFRRDLRRFSQVRRWARGAPASRAVRSSALLIKPTAAQLSLPPAQQSCDTLLRMRFLVRARLKPRREVALLKAIEAGTLGEGLAAGASSCLVLRGGHLEPQGADLCGAPGGRVRAGREEVPRCRHARAILNACSATPQFSRARARWNAGRERDVNGPPQAGFGTQELRASGHI